jgi:peptide/nickel transport system substrate-binding protein
MLCNPYQPVGSAHNYDEVTGFAEYCRRFTRVNVTADAIRDYAERAPLSGVEVPDDSTLVIRLDRAVPDFVYLAADWPITATPIEHFAHLPGSAEYTAHVLSAGPYQLRQYVRGRVAACVRNPVWSAATDPLRAGYVDSITIAFGLSGDNASQQLLAGERDLTLNGAPAEGSMRALLARGDPRIVVFPPGEPGAYAIFLWINFRKKHGPLAHVAVRRAVASGVDRRAFVLRGDRRTTRVMCQAVMTQATGWIPDYCPNTGPDGQTDTAAARRWLRESESRDPVTPTLASGSSNLDIAQMLQQALRRSGFEVSISVVGTDEQYWQSIMVDGPKGNWDIALGGGDPKFWSANNGRIGIGMIFDGRACASGGPNTGCYNNPDINARIDRALTAASENEAVAVWQDAARMVLDDVAIVALVEAKMTNFVAPRIAHCVTSAVTGWSCDMANLWLTDARPSAVAPSAR